MTTPNLLIKNAGAFATIHLPNQVILSESVRTSQFPRKVVIILSLRLIFAFLPFFRESLG